MSTREAVFGRLAKVLEGAAASILLALTVVLLVDVVGRNLLNRPLPWGTEVLEVLLAASIFLLHPVLALRRGHVTVDLIHAPRLVPLQRALTGLCGGTLFAVIAWATWRQAERAAGYGETTPLLELPLAWVYGGMAALSIVTALIFAGAMFMTPVSHGSVQHDSTAGALT